MSSPFKELSKKELALFAAKGTSVEFTSGELVFKQNTPITNVIFLRTGCVKIVKEDNHNSQNILLELITGPEFLGLANTFSGNQYNCSAVTMSTSEICFIDKEAFNDVLTKNGRFACCLLQQVCTTETDKYNLNSEIFRRQNPGRLAQILLYFSDTVFKSPHFELPLTKAEMANLIGISNRSLSRLLGEFKHDGLIENNGSEITLIRKEFLETLSHI